MLQAIQIVGLVTVGLVCVCITSVAVWSSVLIVQTMRRQERITQDFEAQKQRVGRRIV